MRTELFPDRAHGVIYPGPRPPVPVPVHGGNGRTALTGIMGLSDSSVGVQFRISAIRQHRRSRDHRRLRLHRGIRHVPRRGLVSSLRTVRTTTRGVRGEGAVRVTTNGHQDNRRQSGSTRRSSAPTWPRPSGCRLLEADAVIALAELDRLLEERDKLVTQVQPDRDRRPPGRVLPDDRPKRRPRWSSIPGC